jgi:hypothetical protein
MHCVMETEAFARQAAKVGLTEDVKTRNRGAPFGVADARGNDSWNWRREKISLFRKQVQASGLDTELFRILQGRTSPVFLLDVLDKGDRLNLSQSEKNQLKKVLGRIAHDYKKAEKERVRLLSEIAS